MIQRQRPLRRSFRLVNIVVLVLIGMFGYALSGNVHQDGSLVPVAAASTGQEGPDGVEHTLAIDGTARTFRSYVPAGPTARLPLVVVLHGRGQSQEAVARTGFLGLVEQHRAVVVFADGVGRSWNAGHGCCGIAGQHGTPDTAFITALVAQAQRLLPVDPARVYLVGYSNGGKLAYSLSCSHPQLFAAIATYGAVPLDACPAAAPLPMLISYGGADTVLPPLPATDIALQRLLTRDRCTGTPPGTPIGPAVVRRWSTCAADVESVAYPQLGHPWPAAGVVGRNAAGATLMWTFLFNHHR